MNDQDSKKFHTRSTSIKESEPISLNEEGSKPETQANITGLQKENKILTERNNDILESISEAFFTLNRDWQFTYANRATGLLLGREPDSLLGKSIWAEYPGLIGSHFEPVYRGAMDDRVEGRITDYYPDHNRWYEVNIFPASSGGITVYFKDVSERVKAEAEIEKLNERNREILESITDGFFAVDDDWIFTYVNKQATQILEKMPDELLGKSLFEVYPGIAGTEFERAYRHTAIENVTSSFTAFYPDHDRWYEVIAYPAPNGITVYFRNVTERMRTEAALRDSDRKKDEFLATLAHELRNPLAPIRSGLEIIRRAQMDQAKFTETLDIIERQTNQIVHLVDDLLDISRITQGKIKLKKERIDLKTAIEMALETSQELIDKAENELTVTLPYKPIYIDADLTRIAQIFLNILNNAAKYSEPGGKISVTAGKEENDAVISIKDTGLGIEPDMLEKIFDLFGQIQTPDEQSRGGLGIGLSVVKKLVEMHRGSIEVLSEGLGRGSEFIVRLPLAVEQSKALPADKIPETDILQTAQMKMPDGNGHPAALTRGRSFRILVVDDNKDAVVMLRTLLSMEGHTLQTALDAETGIKIAEEFQPEICLCDIGLPGMNGYELAVHLRKSFPEALLISISGWGRDEDRRRSIEAGFDYHLVKPVQLDELLKLIAEKIAGKEIERH